MADGTIDIDTEIDSSAADSGLSDLQSRLEATGKKMTDIGKGMTAGLSVPIAAVGGVALVSAMEFENAQAKMQAQLGLTGAETEKYGTMARDMWKNAFGENIGDVTNAIATVKTNVGDLNDADLQKLTEGAFTLQDVFGTDMQESTMTAGIMMKNFGIEGSEAMDLMTVGIQKGGDYSGELLGTMGEYSPVFASMGHSAQDMMNILISGAEAGSFNLDKVGDSMKEFNIRAKDGSDSTAEGFKAIGLNAGDMGEAIAAGGEKGEQAFQATIAGLAAMEDPVERNAAGVALFGATWEDLEADVVTAMSSSVDHMEGFEGATERAGAAAYDTFGSRLTTAWRTVQDALIPLGMTMMDIAEKFIPPAIAAITMLASWFENLSGPIQVAIVIIGGVVAAIGPLLVAAGAVIGAIAPMLPVFVKVWSALQRLRTVFTVIRSAMLLLTGPVGIIIAIVTTLAVLIYKNWDAIKAKSIEVFNWLGENLPLIWEGIKAAFGLALDAMLAIATTVLSAIGTFFSSVWEGIKLAASLAWSGIVLIVTTFLNLILLVVTTIMTGIQTFFTAAWDIIKLVFSTVWAGIVLVVTTYINMVLLVVTTVFNAVKTFISAVWNGIKLVVSTVWAGIVLAVTTAVNLVKSVVTTVFNAVKTFVTTVFNATKSTVTRIWDGIKTAITNAVNLVKNTVTNVFNTVKSFISTTFDTIKNKISSVWDTIYRKVVSAVGAVKNTITNVFNTVKSFISTTFDTIKNKISSVWDSIKSAVTTKVNAIKSKVVEVFNGLKSSVTTAMNNVKNAVSSGWDKVKSFLAGINLRTMGRNIIEGLVNGIKSMAGNLLESAKGVVKGAIDGAKSLLGIKSPSRVFMQIGEFTGEGMEIGLNRSAKAVGKAGANMAEAAIPSVNAPTARPGYSTPFAAAGGSTVNNNSPVTVHLQYSGNGSRQDAKELVGFIERELAERTITAGYQRGLRG